MILTHPAVWLLLVFACVADDSGIGARLPSRPGPLSERQFFEGLLLQYHRRSFEAHQAGNADVDPFRPGEPVNARDAQHRRSIPEPVLTAVDFYFERVERPDWGSARLYRVNSASLRRPLWIVWVRTDGDDGWVELFDASGLPVGAGRTFLELVAWGQTDEIRAWVATSGYPESLKDRASRTLWAKPPH